MKQISYLRDQRYKLSYILLTQVYIYELDEPGMGHIRKLNEKYFIPSINIIIICVPKIMFIKRSSNPEISPIYIYIYIYT
jgi:hypothetical protein